MKKTKRLLFVVEKEGQVLKANGIEVLEDEEIEKSDVKKVTDFFENNIRQDFMSY